MGGSGNAHGALPLDTRQFAAAMEVVARVRRDVPADLEHVVLFGSRARGTARPDSDVDLLLIFRELTADREPQASQVESIAAEVEHSVRVPLGPWSVSRIDLRRGMRTPMLVDALTDGIGLWPDGAAVPRIRFTPDDAMRCSAALLDRVAEGSVEAEQRLRYGDVAGAVARARDDIVRLCTASLLLEGETRPRRGEAVARFLQRFARHPDVTVRFAAEFGWAAASFGPRGDDDEWAFGPPPGGFDALAALVDRLDAIVVAGRARLGRRLECDPNPGRRSEYEVEYRSAGRPWRPSRPPCKPEGRGP